MLVETLFTSREAMRANVPAFLISSSMLWGVVSVPIPAVAVRELIYEANGQVVKEPVTDKRRPAAPTAAILPFSFARSGSVLMPVS